MSRRFSIVCAMIVFAFASAGSGCSSAPDSTLVPRSGAPGTQLTPQSRGKWTTKTSMPTARQRLAAGFVNATLYAVGGIDADVALNTVEAYDPATDTWTTKAPMPTA